jgi:hypothetical protein
MTRLALQLDTDRDDAGVEWVMTDGSGTPCRLAAADLRICRTAGLCALAGGPLPRSAVVINSTAGERVA